MNPRFNILTHGLALTLRRLPAVLWTYAFNLTLALLFSISLHSSLAQITSHSLAAQRLIAGFDLGTLGNVLLKLGQTSAGTTSGSIAAAPLYLVLYFLLVPGTLVCYQTDTPARLSTLLQQGLLFFWRFVRLTLISFLAFAVVLGPLLALQSAFAAHVDRNAVGRFAFLHNVVSITLIGLVAAALRLYFDLVEVYTVQLSLQLRPDGSPDRRVRRAFAPAFRALRHSFLGIYATFVVLTLAGLSAVVITARIAMHSLAQPRIWPLFLLAQCGLFLMLFSRFWQRAAETTLALNHPIPTPVHYPTDPHPADHPTSPFDAQLPPNPSTPDDHFPDPIPNPEPASPPLDQPDPGVFHHQPVPPPH